MIDGNVKINRMMSSKQQQKQYALLLAIGPTSYSSMTIGLNENFILPIGGGKYGLQLGSFLARPTLH